MKIEKLEYYSSSKDGYIWERHPNIEDITDKINEIIDKLNERNNAEPVKHGKWIKENIVLTSLPPQRRWHCSVCGSIRDGYDESVLTPYYPNCGAKMLPPTQADDGVR